MNDTIVRQDAVSESNFQMPLTTEGQDTRTPFFDYPNSQSSDLALENQTTNTHVLSTINEHFATSDVGCRSEIPSEIESDMESDHCALSRKAVVIPKESNTVENDKCTYVPSNLPVLAEGDEYSTQEPQSDSVKPGYQPDMTACWRMPICLYTLLFMFYLVMTLVNIFISTGSEWYQFLWSSFAEYIPMELVRAVLAKLIYICYILTLPAFHTSTGTIPDQAWDIKPAQSELRSTEKSLLDIVRCAFEPVKKLWFLEKPHKDPTQCIET